jgi:hypothetical protein
MIPSRRQILPHLARAARVARPSTLRGLVRELRWRDGGRLAEPFRPTWEPDTGKLAVTTVVWPERYRWPPQASWVEPIRRGLETLTPIRYAPLFEARPGLGSGVVPVMLEVGDRTLEIAIDYGDEPALDAALLDEFDVIFKMQYLNEGYGSDRVVPGGFVSNGLSLYRYLPHVRALQERSHPTTDAYGRFGADKAVDVRRDAVRRLSEQQRFAYRGGIGRVRYVESLAEIAHARVCIDLPGIGPMCFRLVDYLAVGAAIVSPPHACRLHVPLEEDRHVVYCKSDLSDLVEVVGALVDDPARAGRIGEEARRYFDRFLDYRQLACYYLATCYERS